MWMYEDFRSRMFWTFVAAILMLGLSACNKPYNPNDKEYVKVVGGTYVAHSKAALEQYLAAQDLIDDMVKRGEPRSHPVALACAVDISKLLADARIFVMPKDRTFTGIAARRGRIAEIKPTGDTWTVWVEYDKLKIMERVKSPLERALELN